MKALLFVENSGDIVGGGQISLLDLMSSLRKEADWTLHCICPDLGTMATAVVEAQLPIAVIPGAASWRRRWDRCRRLESLPFRS